MKYFILIYLFTVQNPKSFGQKNIWFKQNDSAISKTFKYWSEVCKDFSSNTLFSTKELNNDVVLIKLANKLYNNIYTVAELKKLHEISSKNILKFQQKKTAYRCRSFPI